MRQSTCPLVTTSPSFTLSSTISPDTSELNLTDTSGCTFPLADTCSFTVLFSTLLVATLMTSPCPIHPNLLATITKANNATAPMSKYLRVFFFLAILYLSNLMDCLVLLFRFKCDCLPQIKVNYFTSKN